MAQRPPDSFVRTFSPGLQKLLVGALARAYHAVARAHRLHPGFNERTFGFSVYEVGVHELSSIAEENADRLRVKWIEQAFRLIAGPYEVAYHKVGHSAHDDIRVSFPNNEGAVTSMVLASYLPGLEPDLSQATRVVLAHMGNPEEGLCAAYLCIPIGHDAAGRINEWGFTYEIFRKAGDGQSGSSESTGAPDFPPDEVIEQLRVTPRKRERKPRA